MSLDPSSGPSGSTSSVVIAWSPTAGTDCPQARAQLRVNGEPSGDPVSLGAEPSTVVVDIPDVSPGNISISLVALDGSGRVLAASEFEVTDDDSDGVSAPLAAAALITAVVAGFAIQRLYARRRAKFGRS